MKPIVKRVTVVLQNGDNAIIFAAIYQIDNGQYGIDFYREIGEKGGGIVKEKYGTKFYSEIGKRGGETVKQERGPEFYSVIGRKGGEAKTEETTTENFSAAQ